MGLTVKLSSPKWVTNLDKLVWLKWLRGKVLWTFPDQFATSHPEEDRRFSNLGDTDEFVFLAFAVAELMSRRSGIQTQVSPNP